jgi:hypothetical protein
VDESSQIRWTFVVSNDDGTWEGEYEGMIAPGDTTHLVVRRATGAYDGLELFEQTYFAQEAGQGFPPNTSLPIDEYIQESQ